MTPDSDAPLSRCNRCHRFTDSPGRLPFRLRELTTLPIGSMHS